MPKCGFISKSEITAAIANAFDAKKAGVENADRDHEALVRLASWTRTRRIDPSMLERCHHRALARYKPTNRLPVSS